MSAGVDKQGLIKSSLAIFSIVCVLSSTAALAANKVLVTSTNSPNAQVIKEIMQQAYQRIGYEFVFRPVPLARSLEMSNSGESDAELFRIADVDSEYPNLRKVPTPILNLQGLAYTTTRFTPEIRHWQELRGYNVGVLRGQKLAEKVAAGMTFTVAKSYQHLFDILALGRVDVVLATRLSAKSLLADKRIGDVVLLDEIVMDVPVYHYVNVEHQNLISKLSAALDEMHQQGIPQAILERKAAELDAKMNP